MLHMSAIVDMMHGSKSRVVNEGHSMPQRNREQRPPVLSQSMCRVFLSGWLIVSASLAMACELLAAEGEWSSKPINFSKDVLPILSDNCFHCHGPDPQSRQAELRLDQPNPALDRILKESESGQSLFWERVSTTAPDLIMPPPTTKHRLTADQLLLLQKWLQTGAPWGKHWAFEPIIKPPVPEGSQTENPIDAFVIAQLHQVGKELSPQADAARLIRRLALDLTGLPPSLELRQKYLKSSNQPLDVGAVVDELLASPHYGERMAWEWLEAARYADTNGYQGDAERTMWPWRDWVVEAFNQNLSFADFTRAQLAGDLLSQATDQQKLATAFLRNHMINGEGGRIAAENRIDYVMDMTETTGTVWLGLTMNCCRCHDHKFDPIRQQDYYQLSGFFNNTPVDGSGGNPQTPPVLEWPSEQQKEHRNRLLKERKEISEKVLAWEDEFVPLRRLAPAEGPALSTQPVSAIEVFDDANGVATSPWHLDDGLPAELRAIRQRPPQDRKASELTQLINFWNQWQGQSPQSLLMLKSRIDELDALQRSIPQVMVMQERAGEPRKNFILSKGLYNQPKDEVSTDFPLFLKSKKVSERLRDQHVSLALTRQDLAEWLLHDENPLVARVIVNRIWQQFFGIGLVKTSEDFGIQGEKPSHPELLDWLAADFREHGWDIKRLVKQMVTSRTYCQTTIVPREAYVDDPENRLLARGPRYRWPAWMLRDQALAVSGLLVPQTGGPPVKPYQPEGLWEEATFGAKRYQADQGDSLYRRSLYTFWRRIIAPPMFFDTANRQTCIVRTSRTNTPLQALALWNDPVYLEAARVLATRFYVNDRKLHDDDRLRCLFECILVREPTPQELELLRTSIMNWRDRLVQSPEQVSDLLAVGASPASLVGEDSASRAEAAVWTVVTMILFNLDETISKE